ncbi:MAG: phosphodiester glycosidase family protein [Clostridia bacterium]|nr:phosphodiester glycosidase family protein [Clostridia bacterium]
MSERKKKSVLKIILKVLLWTVIVILLTALILAGTLYLAMGMICGDTSPAAKKTFVATMLETGAFKFIPSFYLSAEEIQTLVDDNKLVEFNDPVDTSMITIDVTHKDGEHSQQSGQKEEKDIEIIKLSGRTYQATLIIVKDPSRVSVATIYPWRSKGDTLDKIVEAAGAIGGINGGLYSSNGNTGGKPYGVVVSNGEIQYNSPSDYRGLVLIGMTEDNILQIIDINGKSKNEVKQIIETNKIRDAVTFQEESSDANNHFVQLVINGQPRDMKGKGSGENPRTAIGQRADGALLLLVTDGRGKNSHIGATASDLISIMMEYGAVNAANLDGGSSSCMYYDGEYLMESCTFYYKSWNLPLAFVIK